MNSSTPQKMSFPVVKTYLIFSFRSELSTGTKTKFMENRNCKETPFDFLGPNDNKRVLKPGDEEQENFDCKHDERHEEVSADEILVGIFSGFSEFQIQNLAIMMMMS